MLKRSALVTIALSSLALSSASAQFAGTGCGGFSDTPPAATICAFWNLTVAGNSYTLSVLNDSDDDQDIEGDSRIKTIGLGASDGSLFTDVDFVTLPAGWVISEANGNWLNGFGMINLVFDATVTGPGQKNYLTTGSGWFTFEWTMAGVDGAEGASIDQIGFHDLHGSSKVCFEGVSGDICQTNTVPEPATIALVASGIAGLAPFARRRRKAKG